MSKDSDIEAISAAAARWVVRHDSDMSRAEAEEFEQWLAASDRHRAAFEHYSRTWPTLYRPSLEGAQGAIMRELQACLGRRRARRARVMAATACAIVIFAFAGLWRRGHGDEGLPAPGAPASAVVVMAPERRALEDGSVVEIKQGAVIDVCYDDAARRVVLVSGEALFQVVKDPSRPFVVTAGGMEVRAVGTAFVVKLGAEQVDVLVTEGQVAVEKPASPPASAEENATAPAEAAPGGNTPAEAPATAESAAGKAPAPATSVPAPVAVTVAMLGVRERVVVEIAPRAAAPVVRPVTPAEIDERLAWRIPRLEFSATPLAEAVALINHYLHASDGDANARLVLDKSLARLAAEPVSGYCHTNNVDAFVQALGLLMGIEGERRGDEIVLRKKKT